MPRIAVTHFTDPGCPFAWSASPALAALRWRYGDQLDWRHVMNGLAEDGAQYEARGYTPLWMARSQLRFRRYGMPFSPQPKSRVAGTSRACRALIAAGWQVDGREWETLRALQLLQFTSDRLLDDDAAIAAALATVPGVDAAAAVAAIDHPEVLAEYERHRAAARSAGGSPAEAQGKTADTDGTIRFTAPTLVFERDGRELVAGGFQPLAAYDVLLANLDPSLERREAPEDLAELFAAFPEGLVTAEVAQILAGNGDPDPEAAEAALLELVADGRVTRRGVGDDAVWAAPAERPLHSARGGRFARAA